MLVTVADEERQFSLEEIHRQLLECERVFELRFAALQRQIFRQNFFYKSFQPPASELISE